MKRKFKKGDKVQQKNGGPVMKVVTYMVVSDIIAGAYLSMNEVVCTWDDPQKGKQTSVFPQSELEFAEKRKPYLHTLQNHETYQANSN